MNNSNVPPGSDESVSYAQSNAIVLIPTITQITVSSLTVLFALAYTALILIRPAFRQNKLNWLTVNICLQSALLSIITISLGTLQLLNIYNGLPCRVQGYIIIMAICQVLYSHCVASFCRFRAVVYATKRLFRSSAFTWACLAFGWLLSVLITCPYLFLDGFVCPSVSQVQSLAYYTITTTLSLPIAIVAVCNWRIFSFARRSTRQVQPHAVQKRGSHARDLRLMKTLIGTFVIMVIGWFPIFILQALIKDARIPLALGITFQMLPPTSTLLDVFLLIYTNQPVRLFLKQHILRRDQPIALGTQILR